MTCPECGYDGDEWLHDAVKRSDGGNGYICPRCNHHHEQKGGGDDPDLAIFYNLRRVLRSLKALEQALVDTAEVDAGEYLRVAAERAQDIRALVYPAYRARLNECERQKESNGDGA